MHKLRLKDLNVKNKTVLMRVDFNVPLSNGAITDATRIEESLPSIEYILKQGARLILMSHLGRPKGRQFELSLSPCAKKLTELLGKPIQFAPDCVGDEVRKLSQNLETGDVLLLENLRFHQEEEKPEKNPLFAQELSSLGEVYVNDAFGTAHRKHASTYYVPQLFKGKAACGFLMEKEIKNLSLLIDSPKRPFFAIIGGAKISSKLSVLNALADKIDGFFLGGGMVFTLLKAQGFDIGNSIFEDSQIEPAKEFLRTTKEKVHLPLDLLIAKKISEGSEQKLISLENGVPEGWAGADIGPKTLHAWKEKLKQASTIFWNGPMGVFEIPAFATGTKELAKSLAALKADKVIGGGDSVAAIKQMGLEGGFTHLSTGGGASLEFIVDNGHLPGIDILTDASG